MPRRSPIKAHEELCPTCGQPFLQRRRVQKYCSYECSMQGVHREINELHTKSGPGWEAWKAGMRRYFETVDEVEPGPPGRRRKTQAVSSDAMTWSAADAGQDAGQDGPNQP